MKNYKTHLIDESSNIKEALLKLNEFGADAILFIVDKDDKLLGSLTDGDVRRGLLKGLSTEGVVGDFMQQNPRSIQKGDYSLEQIIKYRSDGLKVIPVLDNLGRVVNILNFRYQNSYLPVDAVVMAGGLGSRLRPLTNNIPKPLLKVGDKAIIDHNVDRLRSFGVDDFWISVRYLGEKLEEHFGNGSSRSIQVDYVWEDEPLGTIGAVSKIDNLRHDVVLVTNSDVLTDLDYEDFYLDFIDKDADMSVVSIPYKVNIPYAVLETESGKVSSFKEKPTYTYYSNGGIYLIKRSVLDEIPRNQFFNSTDLMEKLIKDERKLISYEMRGYWLDVGKHEDYEKAQEDIKHLNL